MAEIYQYQVFMAGEGFSASGTPVKLPATSDDIEERLNELGREGYRLASVARTERNALFVMERAERVVPGE